MSLDGLLEIGQGTHTVLQSFTYRPVEFELKIISKAQVPLTVAGFDLSVRYDGVPVQVIHWQSGNRFASIGLEAGVHDLEPLDTVGLRVRYNPVLSQVGLPPRPDRWTLEGSIWLSDSENEVTVKQFELWNVQVSESGWEYHRQQYQEFVRRTLEG